MAEWGRKAKCAIGEAYLEFANSRGYKIGPECSDDDKKAFLKIMDAYYPFGERAMWPYKAWLKERKKIVKWLYPVVAPLSGLFAEADSP